MPGKAETRPRGGGRRSVADPKTRCGAVLTDNAEALIVRGKEQGYLTPDDIKSTFSDLKAESDHPRAGLVKLLQELRQRTD